MRDVGVAGAQFLHQTGQASIVGVASHLVAQRPTAGAAKSAQFTIRAPFAGTFCHGFGTRITIAVANVSAVQGPTTRLRATHRFLNWLSGHRVAPSAVNQALIERWCADFPGRRTQVAGFVTWARRRHLIGSVRVLKARINSQWSPLHVDDPDQLYAAARRCLTDPDLPSQERFAAALVVLYGQPANKISTLRLRDLALTRDGALTVHFGTTPLALPPILAEISSDLIRDARRTSRGSSGSRCRRLVVPWSTGEPPDASLDASKPDPAVAADRLATRAQHRAAQLGRRGPTVRVG